MRFINNPFTDKLDCASLQGSGAPQVEFLTGNSGGQVGPDGSFNINVLGDNTTGLNIVGNPGANTLTVFGLASSTTQVGTTRYSTDAEAAAQTSTTTALTPSNITSMFSTTPLPASQGGTGRSSPAAHSLLVTNGSSAFTVLGTASNGQIPIGSIGGDPVLANITSSGGTITVTNGPGTINIDLSGGTVAADSFSPDSGTDPVVPTAAGLVNVKGSGSVTTVGSLNTITTQLTGLTNHALLVGAGTTTITKVGPSATTGQVLQSQGASADPAFSTATYPATATGTGTILRADGTNWVATTATYPATTTVSQLLYSSSSNVVAGLATANRGVLTTGATGIPVVTALATDGQVIIGSTAGVPAAATLTAGTGISITNGSNSISIATNGSSTVNTLTGNSGGAISPTAGNINTLGTGSITIAGSGSTLTTQLTGLTNHAIQIGAGTATLTQLGAGTTGQILQTNTTADPTWSTATYPSTATGTGTILRADGTNWAATTATYPATTTVSQILYSSSSNVVSGLATANRAVLTTGATGIPVLTALATDGQLIIGSTAGVPAAATLTGGTGISVTNGSNSISLAVNGSVVGQTITGDSGGAISPTAGNWNLLGSGSITTSGSGSTHTTQLTGLTNHAILVGAGTTTITKLAVGSTGQILQGNTAADPSFSTATYPSTTTVSQILYSSSSNVVAGLATANRAVLTTSATGVPVITALATDGQVIIGSTAGAPAAATITAGVGISVTNASNSITIAATGAGFTWTNVTGTTQTIAAENGYLSNNAGTVTFTLPASGTIGDAFRIVGLQGAWTVAQSAGQQIKFGSAATTAGVTGSIASTNTGDCIECVATNTSASTVWRVMSSIGNLTVT